MIEQPIMQRSLSNISSPKSMARRKLDRVFKNNEYGRSKSNFNEFMIEDRRSEDFFIQHQQMVQQEPEGSYQKVDK